MVARRDVATDLCEVQVHHIAVGYRQNERDAGIARGTDGAKQIRPIAALVARGPRSAAALGPNPGQRPLLADAGFVRPPKLDRLVARMRWDGVGNQIGKVFWTLKVDEDPQRRGSCFLSLQRRASRAAPRRWISGRLRAAASCPKAARILL